MTPTNKLRWLKVPHKNGGYADLTLQQWWAEYHMYQYDYPPQESRGEWRDVPVEVKSDD